MHKTILDLTKIVTFCITYGWNKSVTYAEEVKCRCPPLPAGGGGGGARGVQVGPPLLLVVGARFESLGEIKCTTFPPRVSWGPSFLLEGAGLCWGVGA